MNTVAHLTPPSSEHLGRPRLSWLRRAAPVALLGLVLPLSAAVPGDLGLQLPTAAAEPPSGPGLVFTAVDRATKVQGVYTANADGSNPVRITPADGKVYEWGRWTLGNTKILYTVRATKTGSPGSIGMMNPDGSAKTIIRKLTIRVDQPVIDSTGRYLFYTGRTSKEPKVALYSYDLKTKKTVNLTALHKKKGGFDADPFPTPTVVDGRQLIYVERFGGKRGNAVEQMSYNGKSRGALTSGDYSDTDPSLNQDGTGLVYSSLRPNGRTEHKPKGWVGAFPEYWYVMIQKREFGATPIPLNYGANCIDRPVTQPCTALETSGFIPRFIPTGFSVSFLGALDRATNCICAIDLDRGNPRAIIASQTLAFTYQDWPQPAGYATAIAR